MSEKKGVAPVMSTRESRAFFTKGREIIAEIQALEAKAFRAGFIRAGHALNKAKNEAGWEYEANISGASTYARKAKP